MHSKKQRYSSALTKPMASGAWTMRLLRLLYAYPEIILSIACFLIFSLLSHRRRPSAAPMNLPVVGMLPSVLVHFHNIHDYLTENLREVGCTFAFKGPLLLGMDYIATCDPANVNHILKTNFHNYPKGDEFAEIFDILGDGMFNSDAESRQAQRKAAHALIGDRSFRRFVASTTRNKVAHGLFPVLDHLTSRGEPVDIQDVFMRVAFDVMCITVFGIDPGSLSLNFPTVAFAKAMDDAWEALLFRHALPKSIWKIMSWLNVGKERTLARAWDVIDCFIAERISEKRKERNEAGADETTVSSDLLTQYMEHPVGEGKGIFGTDKFLRDTVLTLMIAGRDGFAITLSWLFFLLSKNPHVQKNILEELRAHAEKEQVQSPSKPVSFGMEDISSMIYLNGAVLETLRLYPAVPYEHKAVVKPDVLPSGHVVRPRLKILLSVYAMGRLEGIWGKDYMEFRPERWVTDEGKLRHVPAYKFMAFNSGPRICLGKDVALTQIKTVAAAVLWNYDVEVVDGLVPSNAVLLRVKNGLKVIVRKGTR